MDLRSFACPPNSRWASLISNPPSCSLALSLQIHYCSNQRNNENPENEYGPNQNSTKIQFRNVLGFPILYFLYVTCSSTSMSRCTKLASAGLFHYQCQKSSVAFVIYSMVGRFKHNPEWKWRSIDI